MKGGKSAKNLSDSFTGELFDVGFQISHSGDYEICLLG
jgi:hypothetical protein